MKTKLIALSLALALTLAVSGCAKPAPGEADASPSALPSDLVVDPVTGQVIDPDTGELIDPVTGEPSGIQAGSPSQQGSGYNPSGTVLLDRDGLTVTVDDLRRQEGGSIDIELELSNSGPMPLTVSAASSSVNGYMAGVYFSAQVPAGGEAFGGVTVYADELAELGMADLADVSLCFTIDGADGSHTVTDPCSITFPTAALYDYSSSLLRKALVDPKWAGTHGYQVLHAAGEILYDQDGISLPIACVLADRFDARQLRLEVQNGTREQAVVMLEDVTCNGSALWEGNYGRFAVEGGKRQLITIDLEGLINRAQGDFDQLQEIGFTLNGTPITIPIA